MKKRAYAAVLTALVALMVASGASAKCASKYSANAKAARHMVAKQPGARLAQKSIDKASLRRAVRGTF